MLGTEAQANQRRRADFSVIRDLLIRLELFYGAYGIIAPLAVHFAFVITLVGKRLLDLLVTIRIRVSLVGGPSFGSGGLPMGRSSFLGRFCRWGGGKCD